MLYSLLNGMFRKPSPFLVYDTAQRKLVALQPRQTPSVRIYTCGPTLYKPPHIGNLRAYVFADTLNRALRLFGYRPNHVINLTDVGHLTDDADGGEDKVEKQAKKENRKVSNIITVLQNHFFQDLKHLNIPLRAYTFPKATEYIREQIALAKRLEEKGYAYTIADGLYFDTTKFPTYGRLGRFHEADKQAGARVAVVAGKRNPNDFALWKKTLEGVKRQQEWDSPWGRGFPGWHLECSTMAMQVLGETLDIHTGGIDHIAIHHNNEIAQSEAVTGKPFATTWMHCAFLKHNNEKFSKSLNNTYTIQDLIDRGFHPLALRYFFLTASYRSPLSFSFETLSGMQTAVTRLNYEYAQLPRSLFAKVDPRTKKWFDEAFSTDINTPTAIALLWGLLKEKHISPAVKRKTVQYADRVLGILSPELQKKITVPKELQTLLKKRNEARKIKNYDEADTIRRQIEHAGYVIEDTSEGSRLIKQ